MFAGSKKFVIIELFELTIDLSLMIFDLTVEPIECFYIFYVSIIINLLNYLYLRLSKTTK